jgi:hypothetical protein
MMATSRAVITPGEYRLQPGYYRIMYQLAAQRMNRALVVDSGKDTSEQTDEAAALVAQGRETAEKALETLRPVLSDLVSRERLSGWRLWGPKPLTPRDRGLMAFLSRTVSPCLNLLVAGAIQFDKNFAEADKRVAPIRELADQDCLSYRALYDLACYEAGREGPQASGEADSFDAALSFLQKAFSRAEGKRRAELVRWAKLDPSLAPLTSTAVVREQFLSLLKRYAPSTAAKTASA